jgi:glycine/D-amino acid oxidase-like deaminating enzyme
VEQSVRSRSEVLDVLKRLVDLHVAMGRTGFERAISWAKRLLALDPLAEAMHRQLMWIALHEREPGLRIALIGPPARAGGATLAAGAMLGCFGEVTKTGLASEHGRAKLEMAIKASGLWPMWLAKINERAAGKKPAVVTPGTFVILNTKSGTLDTDNYEIIGEALERHNQSWEDIRPESVPGLSPISGCRSLRAMHLPNEGSIDSSQLLENLALAVRRTERVTEIDGQVKELLARAGRIEGVELEGGERLGAGSVVLAAGAMSQRVLDAMPDLAVRIPRLCSGSGTSALLKPERPSGITGVIRTPNRAFACGLHVVRRADGDVYVGATNNIFLDQQERPNVYDMTFLLECLTQQVQEALHVAELVRWRTGNRPMTIDTYPLIGKTSINGLWLLTGTFRDGLHMSPLLAQHIAQELLGREGLFQNVFPPTVLLLRSRKARLLQLQASRSSQPRVYHVVPRFSGGWISPLRPCRHQALNSSGCSGKSKRNRVSMRAKRAASRGLCLMCRPAGALACPEAGRRHAVASCSAPSTSAPCPRHGARGAWVTAYSKDAGPSSGTSSRCRPRSGGRRPARSWG